MAVHLDHTIVWSHDREASAAFVAEVLGLPGPTPFGPFSGVATGNGVTLDFGDAEGDITPQHYAFLIGEDEFDPIFTRIRDRGLTYWADPGRTRPGEVNRRGGGRGVYFEDPSGHLLEIMTRPHTGG